MSARVTVIVLNYNGRDELADCIRSMRSLATDGSTEVLVADNGSTDDSMSWLRESEPWVRVLELDRNWGFAVGMNRAIASVRTPYFALLNNDTEVEENWISPLVEAMESDERVAAVQARIMFHDRRQLIQSAGGGLTRDGYGYDEGYSRRVHAPFDRRREIVFASAGAALYRRSAWEDVGPFDPAYFMYHEDVDWSWRAWLAGWRVLVEPRSVVYHKLGATTSKVLGFSARQALGERHRIRTLLKLGRMPRALRRIYGGLRTRDWARAKLLLRCLAWNLLHLPGTLWLRARAPIRASRSDVESRIGKSAWVPGLTASYRPTSLAGALAKRRVGVTEPIGEVIAGRDDVDCLGTGWYEPQPTGDGVWARFMVEEAELFAVVGRNVSAVEVAVAQPDGAGSQRVDGHIEPAVLMVSQSMRGVEEELERMPSTPIEWAPKGTSTMRLALPRVEEERILRLRFVCERPRRFEGQRFGGRELGFGWCAVRSIARSDEAT